MERESCSLHACHSTVIVPRECQQAMRGYGLGRGILSALILAVGAAFGALFRGAQAIIVHVG